jgi:hypothetical protein
MEFKRRHHQAIASVLYALDGQLLRDCRCLFGGGTAIALRYGEYRESVDMDFLVSDIAGYRQLRSLLTGSQSISALTHAKAPPLKQDREIRADQYGIRTGLLVSGQSIKFEVVFEARMELVMPDQEEALCSIATLIPLDMVTAKLLANSDRWRDDGVFSRDVIDLAMLAPSPKLLSQAIAKAATAYGDSIVSDLAAATHGLLTRSGWIERCMKAMDISVPKAVLWKRIRVLQTRLEKLGGRPD